MATYPWICMRSILDMMATALTAPRAPCKSVDVSIPSSTVERVGAATRRAEAGAWRANSRTQLRHGLT